MKSAANSRPLSNPSARTPTAALLRARDAFGFEPKTDNERRLFQLLTEAYETELELRYEESERVADLEAEIADAEADRFDVDDIPEAVAKLHEVKAHIEERRRREPLGNVTSLTRHADIVFERKATDLLQQLYEEVAEWRELGKEFG